MKIKLHFNRSNMGRGLAEVWSAHTHKSCNPSEEVQILYQGKVIGRTVFNPEGQQPRAHIEFFGDVTYEKGKAQINVK